MGAVEDTEQGTKTYAGYDLTGRPAKKTKLHGTDHVYTGEIKYNGYDLPGTFTEQVGAGREKHKTTFAYDDENRVNCLTYDGSNGKVEYTYDQLGRITQKKVTLNGHDQITSYTYAAGSGANATTSLIHTITQNGVTLTYTYDDNGNITSVSDGTKTVSYEYDAIGQLIRVNDPYDTRGGANGTTWIYTYDLGGNIQSFRRYAYTETDLGTKQAQTNYTYGDSGWKDLLTAYGGGAIQNDAIGNILSSGAWTYESPDEYQPAFH